MGCSPQSQTRLKRLSTHAAPSQVACQWAGQAGSRAVPPGVSKSGYVSTCHISTLTFLGWEKKQGGTGKNVPECSRMFQPAEPARLEAQEGGEPGSG